MYTFVTIIYRHWFHAGAAPWLQYVFHHTHYSDVIMSAMAFQITGASNVCSIVGSGADQRKHQSSASLAFVWWPVTGEFPEQRASNAENVSIWWRHYLAISCGKSFARPLQANSAFFFLLLQKKNNSIVQKICIYVFRPNVSFFFFFSIHCRSKLHQIFWKDICFRGWHHIRAQVDNARNQERDRRI